MGVRGMGRVVSGAVELQNRRVGEWKKQKKTEVVFKEKETDFLLVV